MRYLIYKLLASAGSSLIGFSSAPKIGRAMAGAFRLAVPPRFGIAAEAIALRLDKPRPEAERMAARSLAENFTSFIEILLASKIDESFIRERVEIADPESYEQVRKPGRPVILATAHLGSWELMSGVMTRMVETPGKQVVVRKPKDEAMHKVMSELRAVNGLEVVEHRKAAFKLLKSLKKGGGAAFLVDHNCSRDEAVFLPFLGRVAAVNAGPAVLAVRAKALVVPAFLVRLGPGRYRLHTDAPLDAGKLTGERGERIREVAEFYTRAVERYVRMYPEQWFWMHKRWKTRPPGEDAAD